MRYVVISTAAGKGGRLPGAPSDTRKPFWSYGAAPSRRAEWARKYGVLGLEPADTVRLRIGGKSLHVDATTGDGLEFYPQGSHSYDSVSRFVAQARIAAAALAFYELARKADAETIAKLDAYDEFYPPGVQLDNLDVVEARKWGCTWWRY